jgi:hypothetical protein
LLKSQKRKWVKKTGGQEAAASLNILWAIESSPHSVVTFPVLSAKIGKNPDFV